MSGKMTANGIEIDPVKFRKRIAYVPWPQQLGLSPC